MRVDANVSVSEAGKPLGTRTEIKNIAGKNAVADAVEFEIKRQIQVLENGGTIVNETLNWDAVSNKTISMRDKESKQVNI